ncbi:MAG TPA: tetratricopeptide repeat protein [Acidimicrobiia bacterium]|nr:tetratricopeptide repeat protein [Acidimicrobiia bacterium]
MDASTAGSLLAYAEDASARSRAQGGKAALDELVERSDDVLDALAWFVGQGQADEAFRLTRALYRYWITKRLFDAGSEWFGRVLALSGGDDRLRGQASVDAGFMPFWLGDDQRATELFEAGLAIGWQLDDATLISQALGGLSRVALRTDVPEGRRLAREALEISDLEDDESGRSNALHLLGVGAQIAGDLDEARDWMSQRLELVRASDNGFLVASEASNLAMVERQLGNLDEAESLGREAIRIGSDVGDEFTRPFAVAGLAAVATERGQLERAAKLLGAAETMMEAKSMAWPPDERPHYEHMLSVLPRRMGSEAFERARQTGQRMDIESAVAYALAAAGPNTDEITD